MNREMKSCTCHFHLPDEPPHPGNVCEKCGGRCMGPMYTTGFSVVVYGTDISKSRCFLLYGRPPSGREITLMVFPDEALAKQAKAGFEKHFDGWSYWLEDLPLIMELARV